MGIIVLLLILLFASPVHAARLFATENGFVNVAPVTARPIVMCAAFRMTTDLGTGVALIYTGDKDVNNTTSFALVNSQGLAGDPATAAERADDGTVASIDTTNGVTINVWSWACGSWIAANSRAVILNNGTEATNATSKTTTTANFDRVAIGQRMDLTPDQSFTGDLCDVAMWNVNLTAMQKRAFMNGVNPRRIDPVNLKGYWPVWGIHSPEVDVTRQKNNLTLTGTSRSFHCARTPATR